MIAARSASPRFWLGLLMTAALHAAILWVFAQHQQRPDGAPREARATIQWLQPMRQPASPAPAVARRAARALRASPPASPPAPAPAAAPPRGQPPQPAAAQDAADNKAGNTPAPAPAPQAIAPTDPFATAATPAPTAAAILAQARKDVGKIDRELRKAYPERGTPPESRQARLERAFDAAHDAVPPKWYEPAKTVEITPPNAHTRMYRVTTALLTYCISISEDGRKSYTNCPK